MACPVCGSLSYREAHDPDKEFADLLRDLREQIGLDDDEVEALLKIRVETKYAWERNGRRGRFQFIS